MNILQVNKIKYNNYYDYIKLFVMVMVTIKYSSAFFLKFKLPKIYR